MHGLMLNKVAQLARLQVRYVGAMLKTYSPCILSQATADGRTRAFSSATPEDMPNLISMINGQKVCGAKFLLMSNYINHIEGMFSTILI